jgi:hypothetical protein
MENGGRAPKLGWGAKLYPRSQRDDTRQAQEVEIPLP